MATASNHHWDVGAYALGVLDADDAAQFEDHLLDCRACGADLESFLPVTELLSHVDLGDFAVAETKPDRARRRPGRTAVRNHQRAGVKPRRAPLLVAAAVLVSLMGASYFVGTRMSPATGEVAAPPPATIGAPSGSAQRFEGTTAGVTSTVDLTGTPWGTGIGFSITGVRGPLICELVVVDRDGQSTVAMSWKVPPAGYGTPEQPNPLSLRGATFIDRDAITRFEVRATDAAGGVTTIGTITT